MDTAINRDFADGVYRFWLPMPQVIAAEREMARRDSEGNPLPHSIFAVFHDLGAHLGQLGDLVVVGDQGLGLGILGIEDEVVLDPTAGRDALVVEVLEVGPEDVRTLANCGADPDQVETHIRGR